jgi:NAD(P)H-hydrate epimerase
MLAERFNADVALKGPGTVVASALGDEVSICQHGNPGMASAGMGDVLAGLLGGLLAGPFRRGQVELSDLFAQGVALHSAAADHAAQSVGQRSLLASDVVDALPAMFRGEVK